MQTNAGIFMTTPQTENMSTNASRAAIIEYIRGNARPVDKLSHQERLYDLTKLVGAGQAYDDDVVFAAAWMHDLGVFIGHRPEDVQALAKWDSKTYAVEQVPGVLGKLGFPREKIPAVIQAIAGHLPGDNPQTLEGIILRDADILEQLGAAGILRCVCKIGRDTRFQVFPDALRSLQKALETLPPLVRLETSRKLSEPRIAVLKTFLDGAKSDGCIA
jgi:uncharacterized protein